MRRISATVVMAAITAAGVVSACNTDGLTGPAQPAQRATPGVQRALLFHEHHVPFTTSSSNPCAPADGPIAFTGYINVLVGSTVDASGGIHLDTQLQEVNLSGTGLTGKEYKAGQESSVVDNVRGTAPLVSSLKNNWRIIGPDRLDNYFMYTHVHMTINANGVPTASVDEVRTECR